MEGLSQQQTTARRNDDIGRPKKPHLNGGDGNDGEEKTREKKRAASGPKLPKMKRPSQRMWEMFIYAAPLFLMDMTMIKKYAGVPIADIIVTGGYKMPPSVTSAWTSNDDPYPNHDLVQGEQQETFLMLNDTASDENASSVNIPPVLTTSSNISPSFLLPTLHNFSLNSPIQTTRALPPPQPHPPTSRQILLQLISALVIYDTLFFLFHLFLHRPPFFKSFITSLHSPHHTHAEIHPQVTNRLTIVERLSLVLLANFSLNLVGAHVLTRSCFVPVFVFLLVQIHSGLDLDWGYERILPAGWAGGSVVHARHHRVGGDEGLAPFFAWGDMGLKLWDGWTGRAQGEKRRGSEIVRFKAA